MGLQAVTAGLAHLRALTAALHESQHALLRHQWGLCSVDVSALVKDMQARLEHRLMQHRQGLTQVNTTPPLPRTSLPHSHAWPCAFLSYAGVAGPCE